LTLELEKATTLLKSKEEIIKQYEIKKAHDFEMYEKLK